MINIPCNGKQICLKTALLSTLSPGDVVDIPTGYLMTLNLHGPKVPENFVRTLNWAAESIYFRQSWKCWLLFFLPNSNVKLWNMEIIPRIVVFFPPSQILQAVSVICKNRQNQHSKWLLLFCLKQQLSPALDRTR